MPTASKPRRVGMLTSTMARLSSLRAAAEARRQLDRLTDDGSALCSVCRGGAFWESCYCVERALARAYGIALDTDQLANC